MADNTSFVHSLRERAPCWWAVVDGRDRDRDRVAVSQSTGPARVTISRCGDRQDIAAVEVERPLVGDTRQVGQRRIDRDCEPLKVTVLVPLPLIAPLVTPPTAVLLTVSVPLATLNVTETVAEPASKSAIEMPLITSAVSSFT